MVEHAVVGDLRHEVQHRGGDWRERPLPLPAERFRLAQSFGRQLLLEQQLHFPAAARSAPFARFLSGSPSQQDAGGRVGIRTNGPFVANEKKSMIRRGATIT